MLRPAIPRRQRAPEDQQQSTLQRQSRQL